MNTDKQFEQALRETLRGQAAAAPAGPDGPSVLKRARLIRRHRRQGMAALTAAAVAVVVVPLSLALPHDAGSGPGPAGHTDKPTPTQTATPRYRSLEAIPQGKAPTFAYVGPDGLVHENGSTTPLPGGTKSLTTFGEYQGNWVVERDLKTDVYDANGKLLQSGSARGIKYSSDRTQIAFQIGNTVYTSSRNTMGNAGAQPLPVPKDSTLLGFLPQGPVVTDGRTNSLTVLGSPNRAIPLPLMPGAVSQSAGLVAGLTGTVAKSNQEGAVADPTTGKVLWHNAWWPHSFSDDGKYVLATPFDNGTPSSYAILDARTGQVVAQTPKMKGVYLDVQAGWDGDTAVFTAFGGTTQEAILTLGVHGDLTRATAVAPMHRGQLQTYWLGAQP